MKKILPLLIVALFLPSISIADQHRKLRIGRIEKITLPKHNISFEGRIDTGAHTCSIHVTNAKITKVGKIKYIEFDTEDRNGNKYHIKTKVHKESHIKKTDGEADARYVIRELVQLGNITKEVNINLNDRSKLKYNFLVGRNFLRGDFVVDVSLSHTVE